MAHMDGPVLSKIEDAEVLENDTTPVAAAPVTATAPAFDINAYNATLETVRRRLSILEKSKIEQKKLKEMYNDFFANDALFEKADGIVKEATKKRKEIQAQLGKQPQAADMNAKIKDITEQIKENEEALSQELMEYYKTSGVTEIEDAEGNVQEFTIVVKLKSKHKAE